MTEKEKIVVDDVEHTIEDLTQEQKYMIAQIKDLQNKVSQAKFVLDQTQGLMFLQIVYLKLLKRKRRRRMAVNKARIIQSLP